MSTTSYFISLIYSCSSHLKKDNIFQAVHFALSHFKIYPMLFFFTLNISIDGFLERKCSFIYKFMLQSERKVFKAFI